MVQDMQSKVAARRRYAKQRDRKTPPHVSIKVLRAAKGWSLDDVADHIEAASGDRPTRGALSAIENGLRGASHELLRALEVAFEIPEGAITTDYRPRATTSVENAEVA